MKAKRNDDDRRQWVLNDEGLYRMFRGWRGGYAIREFIRAHREQIDEIIDNVESGRRKAHYLVYG